MTTADELRSATIPDWCPGCGDYAIVMSVKAAIGELNLDPKDVLIVSGIGCSSKLPHYVQTYGFHGIHGRPLPIATGAKLANQGLKVIVISGDGDCYGIGMSHFIHAVRRNVDLALVVHDNQIYGLTTGQTSPTSDFGFKTKTTPGGSIENAVRPLSLAIAAGGTFVSRGFAGNPKHLTGLIKEAIQHRGTGFVDVLQPCVTFNKINTYAWYRERAYDLTETGYLPTDRAAAAEKAREWGDKIPLGVLFKEEKPVYGDLMPALQAGPLVKQPLERDIRPLMERFI
jgi:2-oxoglutarate ferredoxin oxidoreductase subunit beta